MTGMALVRPASAVAWELRAAWATGRRVSVTVDTVDEKRIEGHVKRVAATGAFATIAGWHIPVECILAIHLPSRLGDSTIADNERWYGRVPRHVIERANQLRMDDAA